eukprot:gene20209-24193_t
MVADIIATGARCRLGSWMAMTVHTATALPTPTVRHYLSPWLLPSTITITATPAIVGTVVTGATHASPTTTFITAMAVTDFDAGTIVADTVITSLTAPAGSHLPRHPQG